MGYLQIKLFLFIIIIHYIGDFVLQTHEQAEKKSKEDKFLFYHVITYSLLWFFMSLIWYEGLVEALLFSLITFTAHFITDYYTSRWSSRYFSSNNYHNGFLVIGFDQILHYLQLLLTFIVLDFFQTLPTL